MKAVISKQQFIDKIGTVKRESLEQRFSVNLDSDIKLNYCVSMIWIIFMGVYELWHSAI